MRLHFNDGNLKDHVSLDYTINGVKVLDGFDIVREAGGENRALVREFVTEVRKDLRILPSEDDGINDRAVGSRWSCLRILSSQRS